jgi:rfaE bifunctional protein nucleotidyltransferase chain/domain
VRAPDAKIVTPASLGEHLSAAPAEREGLVLANGIFDLFHVGHVRYLEGARRAGRSLLVALNSDASARRLKGEGRPLVPLAERMELVAALQCVDWVTSFEEDSVESLLRLLRPSAHAKGTDYTVESVPERGVAAALGIRTVIVGDPKGHATSDLIQRIRGPEEADRKGSRRG